jgi:hypothetical protein
VAQLPRHGEISNHPAHSPNCRGTPTRPVSFGVFKDGCPSLTANFPFFGFPMLATKPEFSHSRARSVNHACILVHCKPHVWESRSCRPLSRNALRGIVIRNRLPYARALSTVHIVVMAYQGDHQTPLNV